ncbi:MAG: isoprenylcysteine carboxylmethyltransferase family protein [Verrucomicrobia bacterium]|nr:MAG: isoprenylcysteine carboxylmethyltransferase family protein [Verrucomicrobiota bacterium]
MRPSVFMMDYLKIFGVLAVFVVAIFGAAGRWDLPFVWACLGIYTVFLVVAMITMDPDLRRERLHPGPGGKDRNLRAKLLPLIVGQWVLAGLDVGRFHWSDTVPAGLQLAALIIFVAAFGLTFWAMRENRFFSPVVRIQRERGHHVITTGPYQYLRHPGYLAAIACWVCGSLALGSWWAMVPTAVCIGIILRRTIIEDRLLQAELEGYAEYAQKVRYRLLPGIW